MGRHPVTGISTSDKRTAFRPILGREGGAVKVSEIGFENALLLQVKQKK